MKNSFDEHMRRLERRENKFLNQRENPLTKAAINRLLIKFKARYLQS